VADSSSKPSYKSSGAHSASSSRHNSGQIGQASSMAELMGRSTSSFNVFKKGQEVEGTIKKLTPKEILVDIGAKSDALVLEVDKNNMENLLAALKVGDKVKTVIISPEAEEGFPVVSLRRALDNMVYSELDKIFKEDVVVKINVGDSTRGGYFAASTNGTKGFLPSSQAVGEDLSGKTIDAKIIELDRSKKRIIFSQKATEYITDTEILKKLLEKGKKVSATVMNPASYGIFVTIPGKDGKLIEGFIHISEVSYDRVENLSSLYKKGDTIEAAVIEVDPENRRVNLSIKALAGDKFAGLSEKYKKEDKVKGTVKKVSSRGVTFELESGVNGFIPADKIPAGASYKEGDTLSAEVTDIDKKRRVIVLSPIVTKTFVGYR
jgi:small subunit ribosomal protein S1